MSALTPWRQELLSLIPRGFLRRDQGDGLFVSDFPRHPSAAETARQIQNAGFRVTLNGLLALIDADLPRYRALLDACPAVRPQPRENTLLLCGLAQRIARGHGAVTPLTLPMVRETLKFLDAADFSGLYRFLSPASAEAQRRHAPPPPALGRIILGALAESTKGESPC